MTAKPILWIAAAVVLSTIAFFTTSCARHHDDGLGQVYRGVGKVLN